MLIWGTHSEWSHSKCSISVIFTISGGWKTLPQHIHLEPSSVSWEVVLTSGRPGLLLWKSCPQQPWCTPSWEPAVHFFLPPSIYLGCWGPGTMLGSPGSRRDPTCLGALWEQIQVQMNGQLLALARWVSGQREREGESRLRGQRERMGATSLAPGEASPF